MSAALEANDLIVLPEAYFHFSPVHPSFPTSVSAQSY